MYHLCMGIEKPQISQTEFNQYVSRYIQDLKKERNNLLEEIKFLREQLEKSSKTDK